jgi:signal transduction histidine kinase
VLAAPLPDDERERLRALVRYAVLDTESERAFDDLTALASQICETPIALVSLVDAQRQWFKSRVGLEAPETPRELAFCAHAILQEGIFEVANALDDPRFVDNPLVVGAPDIRFYAGAPLVTSDGFKLGTLCVIDRIPRRLSAHQREALRILGRQVIDQLELRRAAAMMARRLLEERATSGRTQAGATAAGERGGRSAERAFLARVTHDLRTPLSSIIGYAELLAEAEPQAPGEVRAIAAQIEAASGHMLRLVNDILDSARLETGELALERAPIELAALVREAIAVIQPLAAASGDSVRFVDASSSPPLLGDATRIRQVLLNLLSNACKFTRDGRIEVTLADGTGEAGGVTISIVDSGIGMDEAQRRRLFRPFAQVHGAAAGAGGTGLGLHITRALCERMGGSIAVESEVGAGSTFTVWLPLAAPTTAIGGASVAVVDGDPSTRAALRQALGQAAPLLFVDDLSEAIAFVIDRRLRGVIVDRGAVSGDELDLLHSLDRLCQESSTPLVLASAAAAVDPALAKLPRWQVKEPAAALLSLLRGRRA